MEDTLLLRYSRQILLPSWGLEGQQKLAQSTVLLVGCGGLGNIASAYLVAAGLGKLILIDDDQVEISNLQRQILHTTPKIGQHKVDSSQNALNAINPNCEIISLIQRADAKLLAQWLPQSTVVLDCSDNFATRHLVNKFCYQFSVPLVSGAVLGWDGQVCVFPFSHHQGPCYACLYDPTQAPFEQGCQNLGVVGSVVGIIGSMQSLQACQLLLHHESALKNKLLLFHGLDLSWQKIQLTYNRYCPVCGET
ncbi:MAG: HesA/MoeB/ThiF family protein [Gammaproteobacteria bacterium]|nr:HesA/MoeB/ThiF family protein [Gammaproteobacteria bacterium]